ncbi:FAD dependent oxidoreductase [Microdochium trichocladiopsis]|uniref:FAD dependent oxidoreductase n=1 Tax=Microdochium trichocladiopsis TaxID=1682393 RepID=A0A9P8Y8M4_9PEZI|nr:FAD dependent oxidoreductase [Microdochium trichocladiopsis]KAH7032721.1 FAD dependent oxidoreductase [Microdochium trichocladiopsis]
MASSSQDATVKDITIIGGGIIGCTTAYYLTRHPAYNPATHKITLLEASASSSAGGRTKDSISDPATLAYPDDHDQVGADTGDGSSSSSGQRKQQQLQQAFNPAHDGIASGASGKAGGLLALWAFPANIVPLSFGLHEDLAREHGGERRWGYRRCWASQVECRARIPASLAAAAAAAAGGGSGSGSGSGQPEEKPDNAAGNTKGLHKDHKKTAAALNRLGVPDDLDWLVASGAGAAGGGGLEAYENMGTPENTAQVHPELFTRSMAALAEEAGVKIITGARVTRINTTSTTGSGSATTNDDALGNSAAASVQNVTYVQSKDATTTTTTQGQGQSQEEEEEKEITLPTTHCIVTAGPWTPTLLPRGPPVSASRAHSVVIKPARPVSAYALFTAITLPAGFPAPTTTTGRNATTKKGEAGRPADEEEQEPSRLKRPAMVEPEIYARPDGTAYACGPTDTDVPLPAVASDVQVDERRCMDIVRQVGGISDELSPSTNTSTTTTAAPAEAKVLAKQACYLPQGGPWIGPVPGLQGVVVAAGHTCWGIQNAPATGKLVSEIVLEGRAKSAKLGGCDPARVM